MNWSSVARRLSRQLDENRGLEIASHIADANDNGEPVTLEDVGSIALLVGRAKARQAKLELPNIIAGLPVALLCTWIAGLVYSMHLQTWDLANEVLPRDPTVAFLQKIADPAWIVIEPLGLYVGWRVVQRLRTGPRLLPLAFIASLLALIGQTFWSLLGPETSFGASDGLSIGQIDTVSVQAVLIASLAIFLPLTFAAADLALRIQTRRKKPHSDHHARPTSAPPPVPTARPAAQIESVSSNDWWAVAAIALGGATLIPIIFSNVAAIPFVFATWMASSFSKTQKVLATTSGLGIVLLFGLLMLVAPQPQLIIYFVAIRIALLLGVWIWMAVTVAQKPAISNPMTQHRAELNTADP